MIHLYENGSLNSISEIQVGDRVYMGRYYVNSSDTFDPLEWQVLAKENDRCLLITTACIDWKPFHVGGATHWANCDLRDELQYLTEEVFSEEERMLICPTIVQTSTHPIQAEEDERSAYENEDQGKESTDLLFLLSVYQAYCYFPDEKDRICAGTPYAVEKGCYNNGALNGACWWLRSVGYQASYAADVLPWGEIDGSGDEVDEAGGVRPAMWVRFPSE